MDRPTVRERLLDLAEKYEQLADSMKQGAVGLGWPSRLASTVALSAKPSY